MFDPSLGGFYFWKFRNGLLDLRFVVDDVLADYWVVLLLLQFVWRIPLVSGGRIEVPGARARY